MKNKLFISTFLLFSFASCDNNDIYFHTYSIPLDGWDKNRSYNFDIDIEDIDASYNVLINIRNNAGYPYQNLWLFTRETIDGVEKGDSIDCYLADDRGKWLGKGAGDMHEMSVFFRQAIRFERPGRYTIQLWQGMRDDVLTGVNDVGVRVEKTIN
ncbi:MAG: gliding motility lipoprotein GldH [Prevotellaceae bacterium]|jgi:gliding motility-associated lipoprotein GldH|nr:gliding motility lipoprotein GldH [Prevotellaceae bacterium]